MVDFSVKRIDPNAVSSYKGAYAGGPAGAIKRTGGETTVPFGGFTLKHRPVGEQLSEIAPVTARSNYQNGLAPRAVEKGQTSTVLGFGGNSIQCRDLALA